VAKLKAPLMSLGASGAIAKTLVFFPWKGINAVREYVIPANPKTALQNAQRGHITTIVDAIHSAQAEATHPLDSDDQVAYSALAQAKGKIMTWFNMACKIGVDALVAGKNYTVYRDGAVTTKTPASIDLIMYLTDDGVNQIAAGKFFFGTSKTNLIHSETSTVVAGTSVALAAKDLSAFMTAGNKYYFQHRPDPADDCEGADSGIYSFVAA